MFIKIYMMKNGIRFYFGGEYKVCGLKDFSQDVFFFVFEFCAASYSKTFNKVIVKSLLLLPSPSQFKDYHVRIFSSRTRASGLCCQISAKGFRWRCLKAAGLLLLNSPVLHLPSAPGPEPVQKSRQFLRLSSFFKLTASSNGGKLFRAPRTWCYPNSS